MSLCNYLKETKSLTSNLYGAALASPSLYPTAISAITFSSYGISQISLTFLSSNIPRTTLPTPSL